MGGGQPDDLVVDQLVELLGRSAQDDLGIGDPGQRDTAQVADADLRATGSRQTEGQGVAAIGVHHLQAAQRRLGAQQQIAQLFLFQARRRVGHSQEQLTGDRCSRAIGDREQKAGAARAVRGELHLSQGGIHLSRSAGEGVALATGDRSGHRVGFAQCPACHRDRDRERIPIGIGDGCSAADAHVRKRCGFAGARDHFGNNGTGLGQRERRRGVVDHRQDRLAFALRERPCRELARQRAAIHTDVAYNLSTGRVDAQVVDAVRCFQNNLAFLGHQLGQVDLVAHREVGDAVCACQRGAQITALENEDVVSCATRKGVRAFPAAQAVSTGTARQAVIAGAAGQCVGCSATAQGQGFVEPCSVNQQLGRLHGRGIDFKTIAQNAVECRTQGDRVRALVTGDVDTLDRCDAPCVTGLEVQVSKALCLDEAQGVNVVTTRQGGQAAQLAGTVTGRSDHKNVVASASHQHVCSTGTGDGVVQSRTGDDVGTAVADDTDGCRTFGGINLNGVEDVGGLARIGQGREGRPIGQNAEGGHVHRDQGTLGVAFKSQFGAARDAGDLGKGLFGQKHSGAHRSAGRGLGVHTRHGVTVGHCVSDGAAVADLKARSAEGDAA